MKARRHTTLTKQVCEVAAATLLVAGGPVALVWWLRVSGRLTSPVLGLLIGMSASLFLSLLGRLMWERQPGSEDLLFSELMVWGYVHRLRSQRRLASAHAIVGQPGGHGRVATEEVAAKQRIKLLERLVSAMETRDPYLHGHSRRVARHSWMIAKRMGLSRDEIARVRIAAAIHDVGKTRTPKAILHKAGTLDDEEYRIIKLHPGEGARMVSVLHDRRLTEMVRHHHERLDGSGYPDGLRGDEIPLGARIIAVADTFDAITSARPYRDASPHRRALEILREESGTRLDPDVVKAFQAHYAGRGPLALWSLLAGIPERILSWLGGSLAGVATAAKVVAVAVLVGGAASSSAGLAAASRSHAPVRAAADARTAGLAVSGAPLNGGGVRSAGGAEASGNEGSVLKRKGGHAARPHGAGATPVQRAASTGAPGTRVSGLGSAPSGEPGETGSSTGHGGESPSRKSPKEAAPREESNPRKAPSRKVESPVKGKAEEAPTKKQPPPEKPAKGETPAATERPATEEKPAKTEKPAKEEKPAKVETPVKGERRAAEEKPAKGEKPGKTETAAK